MNVRKAERNLNRMILPETVEPFSMKTHWFHYHREALREKAILHHHSFFEVHFVRCGGVTYSFGENDSHEIAAGEWILIAPEVPHVVCRTEEDFQKFSLGFSFEDIKENPLTEAVSSLLRARPFTIAKDSPTLASLFEAALRLAEEPTPLTPYRVRDLVFSLCDELLRACGTLPESVAPPAPVGDDLRVTRAKRYVTDNAERPITVADVAGIVHLSEKQLSRIFLETEGERIADFIKRERLKAAKALLLSSDEPLKAISEALGHSSEYNFIRFFKNAEGMTPGAFRRAAKKR